MRAVGDSKRPLLYLVVCCVLNIGLDIFMVVILKNGNCRSSTGNRIFPVCQRILVTWS